MDCCMGICDYHTYGYNEIGMKYAVNNLTMDNELRWLKAILFALTLVPFELLFVENDWFYYVFLVV